MTYILGQIEGGDPSAAVMPLPLVNEELRELAADERSDHTLQATALIHEAYLRLVDAGKAQHWKAFTVSQQPAQAIHSTCSLKFVESHVRWNDPRIG